MKPAHWYAWVGPKARLSKVAYWDGDRLLRFADSVEGFQEVPFRGRTIKDDRRVKITIEEASTNSVWWLHGKKP
jgi:hypothetical protein